MKVTDWLLVGLSGISVLLVPALALLVRITVKSTRTSDRLTAIAEAQRQDHQSLDSRLRFMEEYWMRKGIGALDDRK